MLHPNRGVFALALCCVCLWSSAVGAYDVQPTAPEPVPAAEPDSQSCKPDMACGRAGEPIPNGGGEPREGDEDTDVLHYLLEIELIPEFAGADVSSVRVEGTCTIDVRSNVDGLSTFTVDLSALLNVVSVGGDAVSSARAGDAVQLALNQPYDAGEDFQVIITYGGYPTSAGFGAFQWWIRDGNLFVGTLSEPYYARLWWPCKDSLGDKATMQMHCTVPDPMRVASNGVADGAEPLPGARTKYKWHETRPMAPYLASLATGPYELYAINYNYNDGGPATMPVMCYLYPDHWDAVLGQPTPPHKTGCDELLTMLDKFGQRFGPYPFLSEKYGVAETGGPGGLGANMEHQTISSMAQVAGFSDIMAHELAHHWWGDNVTCATWFDIWLNEGFASYSECLYREIKPGGGVASYWTRVNARKPSNPDARVYRTNINSVGAIFSTNDVYNKGCWVLHMLRHVMGDAAFFDALADYRAAFAGGFASTADLAASFSASFGNDLSFFIDEWVMNSGSPDYLWIAEHRILANKHYLLLRVRQVQGSLGFGLFTMPIDIRVTTGFGPKVFRIWNDASSEHYLLPLNAPPLNVEFDEEGGVDNRNYLLGSRVVDTQPLAAPPILADATLDLFGADGATTLVAVFSEDVGSIDAEDVLLAGEMSGSVAPDGISYDSSTRTAHITWNALPADEYTLSLIAEGLQANGQPLDGEIIASTWYDSQLLPSGDGQAGGDAVFTFSLPAGDADCDGQLTLADVDEFVGALIAGGSTICPRIRSDMNGDGAVNAEDLQPFVDALLQ